MAKGRGREGFGWELLLIGLCVFLAVGAFSEKKSTGITGEAGETAAGAAIPAMMVMHPSR